MILKQLLKTLKCCRIFSLENCTIKKNKLFFITLRFDIEYALYCIDRKIYVNDIIYPKSL
jgi:hypothetical protein